MTLDEARGLEDGARVILHDQFTGSVLENDTETGRIEVRWDDDTDGTFWMDDDPDDTDGLSHLRRLP